MKWILGITGGIAAYKAPELVRLLKKHGADVQVVLSAGAKAFVTPMTLQAVSGRPVYSELWDTDFEAAMGHIELARWADHILIAPLSANRLAALALGMADDLLTTLCLATTAPLTVVPAMNQQMWQHPTTQQHIHTLSKQQVAILGPDWGAQACGEIGYGRMMEPQAIVEALLPLLGTAPTSPPSLNPSFNTPLTTPFNTTRHTPSHPLQPPHNPQNSTRLWQDVRVLVTAGPTREAIDPVRFLSNRSSGKMGFAIAEAAHTLGAEVTLISGPVALATPEGVTRADVISAKDMHQAVMTAVKHTDIFIACAAVADFCVEAVASTKIKKKTAPSFALDLVATQDILAAVAALPNRPYCVGFAAETNLLEQHAKQKLQDKNLDLIAVNDVSASDIGFDSDDNALAVYSPSQVFSLPKENKTSLAFKLLTIIGEHYHARS